MNIIEIKSLTKSYNEIEVLKEITLSIKQNSFNTILGPSGSGKSTLLNTISGLEEFDSGNVLINSIDISKLNTKKLRDFRKQRCSFIFQKYALIPLLTAKENIEIMNSNIEKSTMKEVSDLIGITEILDKFPSELSGGQQQRVAIARAVLNDGEIIFCDEPTGALDSKSSDQVKELLKKLQIKYKKTIIVVTHDETFENISDTIIRVKDGKIQEVVEL